MTKFPQMCRTHKANIFVFSNGFKESSLRPSGRNSVLIIFLWEASQHCLLWCNSLLKKNSAQPTRTSSFTKCGFMWLAWSSLKNYSVVRKKHSTWNLRVISSCQGLSFGLGLLGCVLAGRILFVFYFGVFLFVPEFCKLNVQMNRGTWNGNSFILQDLQFWVVFLILYQLCQWVATIDREIVIFFLSAMREHYIF